MRGGPQIFVRPFLDSIGLLVSHFSFSQASSLSLLTSPALRPFVYDAYVARTPLICYVGLSPAGRTNLKNSFMFGFF